MKKRIRLNICVLALMFILGACSQKNDESITIEIWHYYNGTQKIEFDQLVMDFNESLGFEKGIVVEAFSQGSINQLEGKIIDSMDHKVGASQVPHMITTYSEAAYTLDQRDALVNLEDYLEDKDISKYVESYIEEGRIGKDKQLKIFPTVKSTEVLMVNKTDWEKFAKATGVTTDGLASWEGISRIAKLYYEWTGGKAFFGRDAMANYILVGSRQLGQPIFQLAQDKAELNLEATTMRKIWDNYYIPYISGYYTSVGRFRSDDAKIGEIIALVASTTGAAYFPENVTIGNNDSYDIEMMVLPLPNFENTGFNAVQQGAGMAVLKSDPAHEQGAVEFLKWFTSRPRNLEFSIKTGYLPVQKADYHEQNIQLIYKEHLANVPKQLQKVFPLAMTQMGKYELHINEAFENGAKARQVLEVALEEQAKTDREKVLELMSQGVSHQEAINHFSSDENFSQWLLKFEKSLIGVIKQ